MNTDDMQSLGDGFWYDPYTDQTYQEYDDGSLALVNFGNATTTQLVDQASAAAEGGWLDEFSNNLLKLGTTAAQLAMLYQNVQSSRQLTPTALQNLQQERMYLQTQTQSSQTMWMWVAVGVGVLLVAMRGRGN